MADPIFRQLLDKWLTSSITNAEREELFKYLRQGSSETELQSLIDSQLETGGFDIEENDKLRQLIFRKIQDNKEPVHKAKYIHWRRWAAAAAILFTIGLLAALVGVFNSRKQEPTIASQQNRFKNDVPPPSRRATITLADGRILYLDSLMNGTIITQNDVTVSKDKEGNIIYKSSELGTQHSELVFNTLSNPIGSKVIDLALSDGSHIWLNAGSSITYPTVFTGSERRVTMTGEGYFEIAHDKTKPFIVSANNKADVAVLGTHFNVNAYDDEGDIKVTLLEGSVKVTNLSSSVTIKPGQQAVVTLSGPSTPLRISSPDLEQIMSWKNDQFIFSGDDINTIMRQLSRWYNVEVSFSKPMNSHFTGIISRNNNISQVLKMLESTGKISFEVRGNRVVVGVPPSVE